MQVMTNLFSHGKRFMLLGAVSALLGGSLVLSSSANAINIGGPSDCDSNAVIRCGAHSTAALMNAYQSDPYVRNVFSAFGVNNADMNNLNDTNVAGRVTKDGNVFVDGQSRAVASNAVTGGRQDMPGSTKVNANGAVFYRRPPSASFQQQSLPAFVSMKNGQFQFAVIASCGNAVKATPAKPPTTAVAPAKPVQRAAAKPAPKPAPTPAPTQVQMQSQSQSVKVQNTNTTNVQKAPQQPQPQPAPQTTTTEQPATQPAASEQPGKLVNTGSGGLIGVFLAASTAGAYAYRRFLTRHLSDL